MNQTKPKTIEDILKQFDEEFGQEPKYCCCSREYCYPGVQTSEIIEPIKSFIHQEITTLLESLKRGEKPDTIVGKEVNPLGYTVTTVIANPYNDAVKEFNEDINKILDKKEPS